MSSEKTAAAAGARSARSDSTPSRCCRSWATTWGTTSLTGSTSANSADAVEAAPKLFWVNWFRKGDDGRFLWPGFGDNSRVLKWVIDRLADDAAGDDTAIGVVPTAGALDLSGLDLDAGTVAELLSVDTEAWRDELPLIEAHFDFIGDRLPDAVRDQLADLEKRLSS